MRSSPSPYLSPYRSPYAQRLSSSALSASSPLSASRAVVVPRASPSATSTASTAAAKQLLIRHGAAALDAFLPPDGSSHLASIDIRAFVHKFAAAIAPLDARIHDPHMARCVAVVVDPLNLGTVMFDTVSSLVGLRPALSLVSPPKRAPPAPPTAASIPALLADAQRARDQDMVVVLSALEWTSQHLSRSPSKSPQKRLRQRQVSKSIVSNASAGWDATAQALCMLRSDDERGALIAGVLACQVEAELLMRASLDSVKNELVDAQLKEAWYATPRPVRVAVIRAFRQESPKSPPASALSRQLRGLSAAHLPLAMTTLLVEQESAFRTACATYVTEAGVSHAWSLEDERARASALSALFEVGVLDDALLEECGGRGLKTCLLGYEDPGAFNARSGDRPLLPVRPDTFDEPASVAAEPEVYEPSPLDLQNSELINRLRASFEQVAQLASTPVPNTRATGMDKDLDDYNPDEDEVIRAVKDLQKRILVIFDATHL